jgi:hypothetical protein
LVEQKCNFPPDNLKVFVSTCFHVFDSFYVFLPPARAAWLARDQISGQKPGIRHASRIIKNWMAHSTENSEEPPGAIKSRGAGAVGKFPPFPFYMGAGLR